MNQDLKVIGGAVFGILFIAYKLYRVHKQIAFNRSLKKLDQMSNEELLDLLKKPKQGLFGRALSILKSRGVNMDFALPILLDFLLMPYPVVRWVASNSLAEHFPDHAKQININPIRPSHESKLCVSRLLESTRQHTK